VKEVPLGKGKVALVDDEDYERVVAWRWQANLRKGQWRARRTAQRGERKYSVFMHRFILGAPPGTLVDHRNGDTLDNRRGNLRLATHSQNAANHHKRPAGCASRFWGVSFVKDPRAWRSPWRACVWQHGKRRFFGQYRTEEEAARAYDVAALEAFGEFACLNFPAP
jgi:hypothetical protein